MRNIDLCPMEETILVFKDVVLILHDEGAVLIMGEDTYLIDGEYREKVAVEDLK